MSASEICVYYYKTHTACQTEAEYETMNNPPITGQLPLLPMKEYCKDAMMP